MKWLIILSIFLESLNGSAVASIKDQKNLSISCHRVCASKQTDIQESGAHCYCPSTFIDKNEKPKNEIKRDTLQDFMKDINKKGRSAIFLTTEKPGKKLFTKKSSNKFQVKTNTKKKWNNQPTTYKDLRERIKDIKMRMAAKQTLKSRSSFSDNEKLNLLEKLKTKQDELKEKLKQAHPVNTKKFDSINKLQNRFDLNSPKVGSIHKSKKLEEDKKQPIPEEVTTSTTTESLKFSHVPVVVLLPSSTTTAPKIDDATTTKKSEAVASTIEKIKEKQKEAVLKMKDKIISSKSKGKDKENQEENNL